jgi:hypothetical protein
VKVTVALVGDPATSHARPGMPGRTWDEFHLPYEQREKVEFEVSEDDTLDSAINRAAEY